MIFLLKTSLCTQKIFLMTKILVIGETCIDEYVYGTCHRVCPEAAALCFNRHADQTPKTNLGMAGNVLNNLKSIDTGLSYDLITNDINDNPIIKRRFIDTKYNTIIFREDINDKCSAISELASLDSYDVIVISDYNKGLLSYSDYENIRKLAPRAMIFADTKKVIDSRIYSFVDCIKINQQEYISNVSNISDVSMSCIIIVTTGSEGCFMMHNAETYRFVTNPIDIRDVCGAGDTFLASLVVEYVRTSDIKQSIIFANKMAGKVVQKFGVGVP